MDSYEVNQLRVQDVQTLNANAQNVTLKRVTFKVGANGPFILDYLPADYNAEKVNADIQKEVATLKAIGATSG